MFGGAGMKKLFSVKKLKEHGIRKAALTQYFRRGCFRRGCHERVSSYSYVRRGWHKKAQKLLEETGIKKFI